MPSEDTQFKSGTEWKGNAGGRPKGGLKDYDRDKFLNMTDDEKEKFLTKISPELRYRMAEGNPETKTDITSKGESIVVDAKTIAIAKKFEEELNKQEDEPGESKHQSLDRTAEDKNGIGQGS